MNNNKFGLSILLSMVAILTACGGKTPPPNNSSSSTDIAIFNNGYVEIPDGRDAVNIEAAVYTEGMGFDKAISLKAFETSVYPLLRTNCSSCHSTENKSGSGAQAPLHADVDPQLAHEYALTRVNFREIHESMLSTHLWIDRHNCFSTSCAASAKEMDEAIAVWHDAIKYMLPEVPRLQEAGVEVSNEEVQKWIDADIAKLESADKEFIKYASLHVLHNEGVSAQNLNMARVGLSKALNSTARWAPELVNPVDVNGKGLVYRFDIRDYWGHTLIDTSGNFKLWFGGSDDDLAFNDTLDANGNSVSYNDLNSWRHKLKSKVSKDAKFAQLVWERILKGNVEGSGSSSTLPPNINGFVGTRSTCPNGQDCITPEDFKYAEATQLVYTLTRPDVYNAIMAIPGYATYLENELGVDKSNGEDSYDWLLTYQSAALDSRQYFRANQSTGKGGYFWKTFDTFTVGWKDIDEIYAEGNGRSPFWASPIPKWIAAGGGGGTSPVNYSIIQAVSLFADDSNGSRGGGVFNEDEEDGGQQMEMEVIWSLPNGLQGYALFGGFNQRRTDTATHVARDPRAFPNAEDNILTNYAGDGHRLSPEKQKGISDIRLSNASSCIGCHIDGMSRGNNDIRDWLDEDPEKLPKGKDVTDRWRDDPEKVTRIKELYSPSSYTRKLMEDDRRVFLEAMNVLKQGMMLGKDKNAYIEPTIWCIEWARNFYQFPITRSN